MNLSGSGVSWTLGPRGASIGIGKRGIFANVGIPGSGLSSRTRIGGSVDAERYHKENDPNTVAIIVKVSDEGVLSFEDGNGNALPEKLIALAKKQQGTAIRKLLEDHCGKVNAESKSLSEVHLCTPDAERKPKFIEREFAEKAPAATSLRQVTFLARIFGRLRRRIESENASRLREFEIEEAAWLARKSKFEEKERKRKNLIEDEIYNNIEAMESYLGEALQMISWPRETIVCPEIMNGGRRVFLDVDLPEMEDFPRKIASVLKRGFGLNLKEISESQVQKQYMSHVHGVGFRLIGETLAALPIVTDVVVSAFSQRVSPATGQMGDEYLYSVRVSREQWRRLDFRNLASLDVVQSLALFDLRRDMTKSGKFRQIKPFAPAELAESE